LLAIIGVPARHFPTPSADDALLLAACVGNVVGFAAQPRYR
jgi:hypothetical protein